MKSWDGIRSVLESMSDIERQWYHGYISALSSVMTESPESVDEFYASQLVEEPIYVYSPSGSHKDAPSFYAEGERAEDTVDAWFDPAKFLALAAEIDRECGCVYWRMEARWHNHKFTLSDGEHESRFPELVLQTMCTEAERYPNWEIDWPGDPVQMNSEIEKFKSLKKEHQEEARGGAGS